MELYKGSSCDPFEGMTPEEITEYRYHHAARARIMLADGVEIQEFVRLALDRYQRLFPDWVIGYYSYEKGKERNRQIDWLIKQLEEAKSPENEKILPR